MLHAGLVASQMRASFRLIVWDLVKSHARSGTWKQLIACAERTYVFFFSPLSRKRRQFVLSWETRKKAPVLLAKSLLLVRVFSRGMLRFNSVTTRTEDPHRSKPLISLVPFNLHFHCFQGKGHCYVTIPIVFHTRRKICSLHFRSRPARPIQVLSRQKTAAVNFFTSSQRE